jgi:anaerobic ribonucleoside-triphosphate reductase activating protein
MTLLNVAEICPATHTLGPGQRFVVWVQGCCFKCRGCVSPDWIPQTKATLIEPSELAVATRNKNHTDPQ